MQVNLHSNTESVQTAHCPRIMDPMPWICHFPEVLIASESELKEGIYAFGRGSKGGTIGSKAELEL